MIWIFNPDVEMFSAEIFIHLKGIPAFRYCRRDTDSTQVWSETEDPFHASDHYGGSGSCQPVHMGSSEMAAGRSFCELPVAVGLKMADLCPVILCGRRIFRKIFKRAVSMTHESLCQDQPALRLRENTGVFFCALIVDHGKRTVECVRMVRRIHQDGAVCGIQSLKIYIFRAASACSLDARPLMTAQLCGFSHIFASGSSAAPMRSPFSV